MVRGRRAEAAFGTLFQTSPNHGDDTPLARHCAGVRLYLFLSPSTWAVKDNSQWAISIYVMDYKTMCFTFPIAALVFSGSVCQEVRCPWWASREMNRVSLLCCLWLSLAPSPPTTGHRCPTYRAIIHFLLCIWLHVKKAISCFAQSFYIPASPAIWLIMCFHKQVLK